MRVFIFLVFLLCSLNVFSQDAKGKDEAYEDFVDRYAKEVTIKRIKHNARALIAGNPAQPIYDQDRVKKLIDRCQNFAGELGGSMVKFCIDSKLKEWDLEGR